MVKVNITGKTLEEAISKASIELKVVSDKIGYDIIQTGKKGFFGFGEKEFIIEAFEKNEENNSDDLDNEKIIDNLDKEDVINEVEVKEDVVKEVKESAIEETIKFLKLVASEMGIEIDVKVERVDESCIRAEMLGEGIDLLIGKDGMTLDSLQYLASRVASKHNISYVKVKLDANNYRENRRNSIKNIAIKAADNAVENRIDIKMKPMNPYERRLIHASLQGDKRVKTKSAGSEPFRYVVVSPVK